MSKGLKFFFIAFFVSFFGFLALNIFQENLENIFYAQISQPFQQISKIKIPPKPKKPNLDLQVKSAISIEVNETKGQKILFKKNINQPLPIASLTKLMTAIIVLENQNYDLKNTWITISEKAANQENAPNYGYLDLEIGKKYNVEKLLDLMLIYSSNDAAFALSEVIRTENFVGKMNQKAEELGLNNTYFVNPTGLDPENLNYSSTTLNYFNHSTIQDLVKLSQYILKEHPLIFETSIRNHFQKIENGIFDLFLTQEIIGGKTGYTDEAGGCILFIFKNESGNFLINVILGAPSSSARITEMQKLIDWLNK